MSINMRAKVRVLTVAKYEESETVSFVGVHKSEGYSEDGLDEDNTFAKFTPMADFKITINNPALLNKFERDQVFYVDFAQID